VHKDSYKYSVSQAHTGYSLIYTFPKRSDQHFSFIQKQQIRNFE